jgi:hypothetical protein
VASTVQIMTIVRVTVFNETCAGSSVVTRLLPAP